MSLPKLSAVEIGSYLADVVRHVGRAELRLLGGLLAGMLVFQLVHTIAPRIETAYVERAGALARGGDAVGGDRGRADGAR